MVTPMQVTVCNQGYRCQCGFPMKWIARIDETYQGSALTCINPDCDHKGIAFRAPTVVLERLPDVDAGPVY